MLKHANILLFVFANLLLLGQDMRSTLPFHEASIHRYNHVDSLKTDIALMILDKVKEPSSVIAQLDQEYLLFQVLPADQVFYLFSFNPEPYHLEDLKWNNLYKVYGFDAEFNLLSISTFKGDTHIKSEIFRREGQNLLESEHRFMNNVNDFSSAESFIRTLQMDLQKLNFHTTIINSDSSMCVNFYIKLMANICHECEP